MSPQPETVCPSRWKANDRQRGPEHVVAVGDMDHAGAADPFWEKKLSAIAHSATISACCA